MNLREKNKQATMLYGQNRFAEALELVNELTSENYPPSFLLKGFINEFRSDGGKNLEAANSNYLQAAALLRDPRIDVHLARINMKLGNFSKAKSFTDAALSNRIFPDAWFLAGDLFSRAHAPETGPLSDADMHLAAKYYLKAAYKGRINALIQYKKLQMQLGDRPKTILAALGLVIFAPIARSLLGQRAYYKY